MIRTSIIESFGAAIFAFYVGGPVSVQATNSNKSCSQL